MEHASVGAGPDSLLVEEVGQSRPPSSAGPPQSRPSSALSGAESSFPALHLLSAVPRVGDTALCGVTALSQLRAELLALQSCTLSYVVSLADEANRRRSEPDSAPAETADRPAADPKPPPVEEAAQSNPSGLEPNLSEELVPGNCIIINRVLVTDGVERRDGVVHLDPGTAVHVAEVVRRSDLRRVRGRIDRPVAGWISLVNLDNDYRWARPAEGQCAPTAAKSDSLLADKSDQCAPSGAEAS